MMGQLAFWTRKGAYVQSSRECAPLCSKCVDIFQATIPCQYVEVLCIKQAAQSAGTRIPSHIMERDTQQVGGTGDPKSSESLQETLITFRESDPYPLSTFIPRRSTNDAGA